MNTRFKFRVWDKLTERMIYPHNDNQQHFIIDLNGCFHNLQNGSGSDDYVIQQYTGLNDIEYDAYWNELVALCVEKKWERMNSCPAHIRAIAFVKAIGKLKE